MEFNLEYHTRNRELVGQQCIHPVSVNGDILNMAGSKWKRVDDGGPGQLAGAWLITGRMRDEKMTERKPGPRKTMKILSGTRFQWIAYNSETGDFMGTGGGNYTAEDVKYTESIDFFFT